MHFVVQFFFFFWHAEVSASMPCNGWHGMCVCKTLLIGMAVVYAWLQSALFGLFVVCGRIAYILFTMHDARARPEFQKVAANKKKISICSKFLNGRSWKIALNRRTIDGSIFCSPAAPRLPILFSFDVKIEREWIANKLMNLWGWISCAAKRMLTIRFSMKSTWNAKFKSILSSGSCF